MRSRLVRAYCKSPNCNDCEESGNPQCPLSVSLVCQYPKTSHKTSARAFLMHAFVCQATHGYKCSAMPSQSNHSCIDKEGLLFQCLCHMGRQKVHRAYPSRDREEAMIRKQIAVDSIEDQLNDVPFAATRVYARYTVAKWLVADEEAG